ncbi:helix-turn-helix domain-containing protein [Niastella sp. OAS944]|uniref:helix-turn-helix domain-containing protein n=1 Tax=Niastella sp. OAS944 TaxID=2664089 RepID=UPI00347A84C5|nr:AraC-like DNA-binding protein [Chitinophagaceae bacterium OAS944]
MIQERLVIRAAAIAIRDAIIAHPLSKKTPSSFATELRVDRNKVLPAFKELTGTTIRRFQLERLMEAASRMLLDGMSVKEVAIECGYKDYQNNFTRGFRKVFRMGPEEWLRLQLVAKEKTKPNRDD